MLLNYFPSIVQKSFGVQTGCDCPYQNGRSSVSAKTKDVMCLREERCVHLNLTRMYERYLFKMFKGYLVVFLSTLFIFGGIVTYEFSPWLGNADTESGETGLEISEQY